VADLIDDIWKLLVLFFNQFPAFVKVRRVVCSLESGVLKEWSYLIISCVKTPASR